jgi:hypothetical protein
VVVIVGTVQMFRKEREVAVAVRGEAEGSWPLFIGAGRW